MFQLGAGFEKSLGVWSGVCWKLLLHDEGRRKTLVYFVTSKLLSFSSFVAGLVHVLQAMDDWRRLCCAESMSIGGVILFSTFLVCVRCQNDTNFDTSTQDFDTPTIVENSFRSSKSKLELILHFWLFSVLVFRCWTGDILLEHLVHCTGWNHFRILVVSAQFCAFARDPNHLVPVSMPKARNY